MVDQIQIKYEPEKKDYIRASRALALKTPTFLILGGVILAAMAASVVLLLLPSLQNTDWQRIAMVSLFVGVFYLLYYLLFIPIQLSQAYKGNPNLRIERQITLSNEKILLQIGERSTELDWEHVQKVVEGSELYLIIYRDRNQVYPLLPKRAFVDAEVEKAFLGLLEEKSIKLV